MTTICERIGSWAAGLTEADIPQSVRERCELQTASIAASARAGQHEAAAFATVAGKGPLGEVFAGAAASIAHDWDDYLYMGHTGHSAVAAARAFSPGVITSGGITVWVAGQTATQDNQGNNIANNFEAQVKQVFSQVDGVLKRAGGSLDNVVSMTVFIKESRYGDKFVEMRKDFFKNGNYPGSALITVTNFARPGIEIEIQAIGVVGDTCSSENPCSAEGKAKKAKK